MSGQKLIGLDFTGADLSNVSLVDANLTGAILIDAILTGTDFTGAVLDSADLAGAEMDIQAIKSTAASAVGTRFQTMEEIWEALGGVCSGKGMPEAVPYNPERKNNKVVLLSYDGGIHEWSDDLPEKWYPLSADEVSLVLCIPPHEHTVIESCRWWGGTYYDRIKFSLSVYLYETHSGYLIDSTIFEASAPSQQCIKIHVTNKTEPTPGPIIGPTIPLGTIISWLSPYIKE